MAWSSAGGYAGSEEVVEEALREHQARRHGMEVDDDAGTRTIAG